MYDAAFVQTVEAKEYLSQYSFDLKEVMLELSLLFDRGALGIRYSRLRVLSIRFQVRTHRFEDETSMFAVRSLMFE